MEKQYEHFDRHDLEKFYKQMYLIRYFEEMCASMYLKGKIGGFTHLYIGQEAIAVGSIAALFDKDYVVSAYRDHGHALAKGSSIKVVMAELYGKETGLCKGFGGSMHLFDKSVNFMGGYAIVGGSIPVATGIALSIKYKDEDLVCACYFGDGAVNEGAFHEGLNLARIWDLPIIFICENNLYGMGTAVKRASALTEIYKRAESYNIPSKSINGMDVLEVYNATAHAAKRVRRGEGPYFLEMKTYRFKAHSMADPDRYRTIEEAEMWKERDPIENFSRKLIEHGTFEPCELQEIKKQVEKEVQEAIEFAENSPEPKPELLHEFIYAE